MQIILLLHRYLGMAVGLVMALWCLSGVVMMYRGYPEVTPAERLAGLEPLDLSGCCAALPPDLGAAAAGRFRIEMLAGRPVLRTGERVFDLKTGAPLELASLTQALAAARDFARSRSLDGAPRSVGIIDKDQWTVEDAARRGPVYRIGLADPADSVIYVAVRTGEVVQATDRSARFWAWLGPVPHWLYPLALRQNGKLWLQVVIWTALVGCFLTLTGLYVGIARFRRYASGRWSPYRGWHYWHHIASLIFGVLTLTWVASGLFTVNPWGFLETSVGEAEQAAMQGTIDPGMLKALLGAAPRLANGRLVSLEGAPLGGRLYGLERFIDGRVRRVDAKGAAAPLGRNELASALARTGRSPIAELTWLTGEDAYYYAGYERPAPLPVWRARARGDRAYYLDPVSGQIVLALDSTARASRWLRTGLHDLDFPLLRARPVWDIVVLFLLGGVTISCATGAWLGLRRLGHDLGRLRAFARDRRG